MISSITNSPPAAQPIAQPSTAHQASSQPTPPPSSQDTVLLSNAAKALVQESRETSSQTAKEASAGDIQAIKLQARQAAARAPVK
jgi:hypothetical protein